MKKLMLTFIIAMAIQTAWGDVFITEIADPNNNANARYIELYNSGESSVDFTEGSGWKINKYTNASASVSLTLTLTGTIAAGDFYVIAYNLSAGTYSSVYGKTADQLDAISNGVSGSNGDDPLELVNGSGSVVDQFGSPGTDGTSTSAEYEDGRAERVSSVTTAQATYADANWNTWSDGPGGDNVSTKTAPGDFDPDAWIGVADVTAPSFTATYPKALSITASGFDVAINLDEIGTGYFVVLTNGASAPSSAQVKAGTDAADGAVTSTSKGTISALAASTEYSGSASSLSASTSYDVYVVAQDDEGSPNIQASPTKIDVTTTVAASSPTASTSAASSIDHESATLNGSVTANNASTTVTFEYGLTDSYGSNATAAESPVTGSSGTSVSTDVSSLSASTTYHFRVKAVNSEGTVYGSDATLTTSAAPVSPTSGVVYISEISDAASSSNEFMELYNNSSSTIDLSSTKIIRLSSAGAYDSYTFDFGTDGSGSTVIPANGLLIVSRGNDQSSFESAWGSLPEGVNFYTGTSTLYFGTGRQWQIKDSGTANTNDGTLIDETGEAVASSSNRSYQTPVGTWTTESYSGNATPGELEGTQETSLPVVLSSWKATSSNGIVKLFWITDSEIENQGFIIERIQKTEDRSQNAWKEISSFTTNPDLLGQGSTSSQNEYSYIDMQVKVGKTYNYLLADVDYRGNITRHDEINVTVKDAGTDLKPSDVSLHAAFPNPFNPDVNLSFTLDNEASLLALEVYDIQGALVNTLSSGYHATGIHDFNWDGNDTQGNAVSSGVYMVRLSANSVVHIQRVTLLR